MKLAIIATAIAIATALSQLPAGAAAVFDTSHQVFSRELAKYVRDGGVAYARWKKKPQALEGYLENLAKLSPDEYARLSDDDRKALWINAYNAFTIKIVLDHYPISGKNSDYPANSFRQIPDAWEKIHFKVAGRDVTLDQIEHTILRRDFHDSRTHYVVVCAAKGSPHLSKQAFTGKTLASDLDRAKNEFLANQENISFNQSTKVLQVSKLFQWFTLDFASPAWFRKQKGRLPSDEEVIVEYLKTNGPPQLEKELNPGSGETAALQLEYRPFDWSLNDLP